MRPLRPPPRVVIGSDRQHPPPRLFEPAAEPTRSYRQQEVPQIPTSINDFDEDVREQMRLLEESVRATLQLPPDPIDVPRMSHPTISARSNYDSASRANPPTSLKSKAEEAQPSINLNQWKQLGYPSEYAYAKDLGLLNEKPKPPITATTNNTVSQTANKQLNQISYAQQLQQQVDEKRLQREKEAKDSRIPQPQLSSANITTIGSTRDVGRPNGNDLFNNFGSPSPSYQRPIEGSYNATSTHKSTAPPSKESFASFQNDRSGFHSARRENNSYQQSSGLALGLDATTEKELKRKKQLEYKQQLDNMLTKDKEAMRDQHLSPRAAAGTRQDSHVSMNIYSGANDKPQRMDNANIRYMDPGMNLGMAPQGQEQRPTQNAAPYQLANGVDKTSRRFKQEEYKRELDRQMYEKASTAINNTAPKAQYSSSNDPNKADVNRNLAQQPRQHDSGQPLYPRDPVRPSPYETSYGEQQYNAGDGYYPSQSEMDNDPHFQAYLRRKNEENQYPYHQRDVPDSRNDYGGKSRSEQPPPSYSQAESYISASSPTMISPGHPSRMKHVAEVYGYGSNPLLGDGSSSNNTSHRNGQQKISTNNQKAILDQQVNEVRERKRLEKLKIEEEDQKREKRIQDEIAAEEEKKRKDKQLLQEQAKRELIEMQEKANKDAMIRKGKAAAATATTSATPPASGRAQNPLVDGEKQSHRQRVNDYQPHNNNMGYHESREVYEPVNESLSYPDSYSQQPQQPNRNAYSNPIQIDPSQIDFDNDPQFQAYLRRKAAENQYCSDDHGGYEQRHPAEQMPTSQQGNFDRMKSEQSTLSPSKPSPKQSSRMKLFSDVYGYGSNPLVAGTGSNGAADNDWKPSGGQAKQKISASAQKAILDEQLHAVRERKRLEKLKIEEDDKRREKRAQDEFAAAEEKKRQEDEKKKQLADQERQEMLALQEKVKREALARKGKAAAASDPQPEQSGLPSDDNRRSDRGQFDHISSPLKNAMEGSRSQQPFQESNQRAPIVNGEDFRRDDRRHRPPPPQQQSRDYYYEDGNRSNNYDHVDNGYPDAPYTSTNDSLSYSNTYSNYPPKPNYPPHQAAAPYRDRQNNYGYHGPQYDPRYDQSVGGYPSNPNRGRPNYHNNHMYPGQDNNDNVDFDSSQISDRSFNNYQSNNYPHGYPNGYPQGGPHYAPQHPRNYQNQPPHNQHRAGPRFPPAEYADNEDDNDLSFVSESRLLPANPWSSSDMLSNLIPLGSKLEGQRAANKSKNRNELEQSLASNSLMVYLGSRTPLVEPTRDAISDGNDRPRSASTSQRSSSAVQSAPKSDHTSDERLKRLIEDTNKVIDKEMNATSTAAGLQRQQKDSMKSLLGYQQDSTDRPRGNATPDGQSSVRRAGTGERPTTGLSSVIQRSGVNTIIADSSTHRPQSQQRTGSRGGSNGGGGVRTPASGRIISNQNSDNNPWEVSAEAKEAMRRQLSSAKKPSSSSAINSPVSAKLRSSEDDPDEASYLNDSFS